MSSGFASATDIANRGLQNIGAERVTTLTDGTKNAEAMKFVFHKLRTYEMRRNLWRFSIRRCILRAFDMNTMSYTPPVYASGTTYSQGEIVSYTDSVFSISSWYLSNIAANVGNTPTNFGQPWTNYFGPKYAALYDSTQGYRSGELVYEQASAGVLKAYLSVMSSDLDNPSTTTPDDWDATITYRVGAIVTGSDSNKYISNIAENLNFDPTTDAVAWTATALSGSYQWLPLAGTLAAAAILYPLDSGPLEQQSTLNAYPLPYGYLRDATQDPKAGAISLWGVPTNRMMDDWLIENDFILTQETEAIAFRFAADITDVSRMDAMFCEGLACRMAATVCEELTQSVTKIGTNMKEYTTFMGEARTVNAIELGLEEPPLDDYISTRM